MTFSGRFVLNIISFAAQQGADPAPLLALTDATPDELTKEESRVTSEVYDRVLMAALDATGDPLLGLHMGEHMSLAAAGLVYQIVQSSATVEEALQHCCDFANLGCRALPLSLRKTRDELIVDITPDPLWLQTSSEVVHQTVDGILAFTMREFQSLTLQKCLPTLVRIPHAGRKHLQEYGRVFHCAISTDDGPISMHLTLRDVHRPVITHDYALLRVLVQHAEERLSTFDSSMGFPVVVKRAIMNMAQPHFPSLEEVAASLNMSPRSLQRRLKDLDTTFKTILEDVRLDLARSYLKRPDLSIGEVAYLLDYSEPSAFVRSFKRWTGRTPATYRTLNLAP